MKEFARQRAGIVLHEQVIDGIAAAHAAYGLAARHARTQRKNGVGTDVLDLRKVDAVFVTKRKIAKQVFKRVDAASCQ